MKLNILYLFILVLISINTYADPEPVKIILSNNIQITTNELSNLPLNKKYPLWWMFDDNNKTTWVYESKVNKPIIEISLPANIYINELSIINGYSKSMKLYKDNNIINKLTIENNSNKQDIMLKETLESQKIKLKWKMGGLIKIYIKNIIKGRKYNDTCISELDLSFKGKSVINKKSFIYISGGEYPDYNLIINNMDFIKYKEVTCNAFYIENGKYVVFEHAAEIGKNGITIVNINAKKKIDAFESLWNICNTLKYKDGYFLFQASEPKTDKTINHKKRIKLP